jgi:hypothetical protein
MTLTLKREANAFPFWVSGSWGRGGDKVGQLGVTIRQVISIRVNLD